MRPFLVDVLEVLKDEEGLQEQVIEIKGELLHFFFFITAINLEAFLLLGETHAGGGDVIRVFAIRFAPADIALGEFYDLVSFAISHLGADILQKFVLILVIKDRETRGIS